MNKKDKALVERAEHEGMMFIIPIKSLGLRTPVFQNLSKAAFGIQFCNPRADKDPFVFDLTGSAADIRKGIKYVEYLDIKPAFSNAPIMREGRTYNLFVNEGEWTVTRVTRIMGEEFYDTVEPYGYGAETCEFEYIMDYDCEPEAVEGEFYEV